MNKKIILTLGLLMLYSASLVANTSQMQTKEQEQQHEKYPSSKKQLNMNFTNMVLNLKLSDTQRDKIYIIILNSMDALVKPEDAFTESSFDKQKYIQLSKERKIMKLELKAQMIETVYLLLSPDQKKELRTMIEVKELIRQQQKLHKHH